MLFQKTYLLSSCFLTFLVFDLAIPPCFLLSTYPLCLWFIGQIAQVKHIEGASILDLTLSNVRSAMTG